ncbi:MAG: hypothetical protein N2258_03395 [Brevinematales bacterium]|nr:hypothetical protein [Brevinematales bacterium]
MSTHSVDLVQKSVDYVPDIRLIYKEHLENILPYVFLGQFTRWLLSLYSRASAFSEAETRIKMFLDYLEQLYVPENEEARELISVSIWENLPDLGDELSTIIELLGPELKVEYQRIKGLPKMVAHIGGR